jgi:hypothetical protein
VNRRALLQEGDLALFSLPETPELHEHDGYVHNEGNGAKEGLHLASSAFDHLRRAGAICSRCCWEIFPVTLDTVKATFQVPPHFTHARIVSTCTRITTVVLVDGPPRRRIRCANSPALRAFVTVWVTGQPAAGHVYARAGSPMTQAAL